MIAEHSVVDLLLRAWRVSVAVRALPHRPVVLDIGCGEGYLLRRVANLRVGIGVDPQLEFPEADDRTLLLPGSFPAARDTVLAAVRERLAPDDRETARLFDAVTACAVMEHIPATEQGAVLEAIASVLRPGGLFIATVPSPLVDYILAVLRVLRLTRGMAIEQHYGFDPGDLPPMAERAGLRLVARTRFQLGLNNCFVFAREHAPTD